MKRTIIFSVALLLAAMFLFLGCTQTTPNPVSNPNPAPNLGGGQTVAVIISNFSFNPQVTSISAGDTVTWTNNDSTPHTVTSDAGTELASTTIQPGQTYSHTFNTPGSYPYHCSIHPSMTASIAVQ